jgi:exodeoxyribonuclease V alpha subunit
MAETISGVVEKVYYSSGSWASVGLRTDGGNVQAAGNIASPAVGMTLKLTGDWTVHPKYGRQFTAVITEMASIFGKDAIIAYLSSGFISGIGVSLANRIFERFGNNTMKIIENDYEKLTEISGITRRIAKNVHDTHSDGKVYMDLVSMLKPEITDLQISKIYERYKTNAVKVLKNNPYQLIKDLDGIGFKKADKLAGALGIKGNDPRRINACVLHALCTSANDGGHCFMYADSLEAQIVELVGSGIDMNVVAASILQNRKEGNIVIDDESAIYLKSLHTAEMNTAEHVSRMLRSAPVKNIPEALISKAIREIEIETGYEIESAQAKAVRSALGGGLSVITGGPGTGKTTIIKVVLRAWELANGKRDENTVLLMAPTGKASRRMSEVSGYPAQTIHKGLALTSNDGIVSYTYNGRNPHHAGLIIVDEASMLDIYMADVLMRAVKSGARIVLVGDVDQLPPIGPGNFFRDMVESIKVPTAVLEVSYRQSGKIGINASRANNGQGVHAFVCDDSFQFIQTGKAEIADVSIREYLLLVEKYGIKNVCYLSPMRTKSATGTNAINEKIRDILVPAETEDGQTPSLTFGKGDNVREFRLGDRVMQTDNDYTNGVFNGDMGFITKIENGVLEITFDDGTTVGYSSINISKIVLAYAITIHKSQGSEYKAAVIVQNKEHWFMAMRNLLYTALTRASKQVVLIGDAQTINKAVGTVSPVIRNTKLKQRIK